jgi:exosome complex RNA-binding protein Csl4
MGALEQAIQSAIQSQADRRQIRQIISGTARNVGETACDVEREDAPVIYGVRLNAIDDNLESFVTVYPKEGSFVLAGIVENLKTEAVVLRCSEVEKVKLKIGEQSLLIDKDGFAFNGGGKSGLIKVPELKAQLAKLTARVDGIIKAITEGKPVPQDGGAALQAFAVTTLGEIVEKENFGDIENKNITHGWEQESS